MPPSTPLPDAHELFCDSRFAVAINGYAIATVRMANEKLGTPDEDRAEILAPVAELDGSGLGPGNIWGVHSMPIERPDLYLAFTELPASRREFRRAPRAFILFANRWGQLGGEFVRYARPHPGKDVICSAGELVDAWIARVRDMRRAVRVWRMINDNDWKSLRQLLQFHRTSTTSGDTWTYRFDDDLGNASGGISSRCEQGGPRSSYRQWLAQQMSRALRSGFQLQLDWDTDSETMVTRFIPTGLLAAMWWCFTKEVTGQASYRACRSCRKVIEISTDDAGRYRNTAFCSNSCKQRDYRNQIAMAKRFHAEGRKLAEIAKQLGKRTSVVKGWLANPE